MSKGNPFHIETFHSQRLRYSIIQQDFSRIFGCRDLFSVLLSAKKPPAPPPWPPKKDPLFIFQRPCSPLPFQSAGVRCGKDRVLINRFLFIFSVWAWNGKVWYIAGLSPEQSRGIRKKLKSFLKCDMIIKRKCSEVYSNGRYYRCE